MRFLLLALGEIAVVLAGQVSLPAAAGLQVLVPVLVFGRSVFTLPSALAFGALTLLFAAVFLVERHTLLPLLVLTCASLLALFLVTMARYRIGRRSGGAA